MAKKKKIRQEVKTNPKTEKDTVVFMTAYDVHKLKRKFFHIGKTSKNKELWSQYHIAGFSYNNTYVKAGDRSD